LVRFFRRGPGCKVCVVCFALLTPFAAYVAKDQLRAGQLVVLFLLNYLVLSFFLYSVAEWLSIRLLRARSWDRRRAAGYAFTLLVVPVILFQFLVQHEQDKGGGAFLERSYFVHRFREWKSDDSGRRTLSPPSWRAKGYSFALRDVVTWFEKHATRDALILVGDGGPLDYGRKLFLESQGKLRLRDFPVVLARYSNWGTRRPSIRWENETHSFLGFEFPPPDDLLFLRNQGDGKGWILFESHLLKKIDELDVEYVVVGPHLYFLAEYFQASDTFASVASFRDGRDQIFKVEREALPAPHDVFVGNRNQTHSWIALLTRRLGFPEDTAEALRSGELPPGFQRAVPFGRR
jgi:hypothetical protein